VTLFVLLSGTPPFYHEDNMELFELIKAGEFEFAAPAWEKVSDAGKDFICGLLKADPNDRLTVD
jgi:serine/threonine protein kinase